MSGTVCFILTVAAAVVTVTESREVVRETRQARRCPAGEDCTPLPDCPELRRLVSSRAPGWEDTVKEAHCGGTPANYSDDTVKVCCPGDSRPGEVSGEDLLPSGFHCGQSINYKAVFGEDVILNRYPWMALLGYRDRANPEWQCGGVLLNDRYVLTAAHCAHRNYTVLKGTGALVTVRLGEHVISTNPDCKSYVPLCALPPQDFTPQQVITHRDFNRRAPESDDLALIRLDRRATLGNSVHPLCLPPVGVDIPNSLGRRDAIVAGWGTANTEGHSDILKAAKVPFVEHSVCNKTFRGQLVQEQVCFGVKEDMDSCNKDSGGPVFHQIFQDYPRFVLLAIVSYELIRCGTPDVPAVYTNVDSYRQWIVDNIKP